MKAKEAIREISQSPEYLELAELFNSACQDSNRPRPETIARIIQLYRTVGTKIEEVGERFLEQVTRSYRPKNGPSDKIYASAMGNTQVAINACLGQVREQLPVYIQLKRAFQLRKTRARTGKRAEVVSQTRS